MGTIAPEIDALPPIARSVPEAPVPGPVAVAAVRATSAEMNHGARTFAQTLITHEVGDDDATTTRSGPPDIPAIDPLAQSGASLSVAAAAIGEALATTQSDNAALELAPLLASQPDSILLSDLVALLATGLQMTIEHSGLFYESHLARWAAGAYPMAQLVEEPQMRPLRLSAAATAAQTEGAAMLDRPASAPNDASATGVASSKPALTPQLAAVVHQQLQTLAQPVIELQVAPWPGARVALRMAPRWPWHPDNGNRPRHPAVRTKPWIVDLHLQTRNLGAVTARLDFAARRVGLQLHANHWTAARLHVGVPQLRRRLGSAGIRQADIEVAEDAAT